jgi:nucleoside-diphosphate-sugar epimerase
MNFNDRSVLVVGGAGYVGSVLAARLLETGAHVRILDQLIYDNGFALQHLLDSDRLKFVRGDLRDPATVARAADGANDVVLLASLVGDPICKRYPELALDVNQRGAIQLIEALDRCNVQRFVFASTCSNYGIQDPNTLADEAAELNPQSLYAQTKIAVEQHLLKAAGQSRCVGTVLRVATAYGFSPRMRFDLTVSQFAWELASSDRPLLVYDAETWRPYCHVRDISKAIMTVLAQPEDRVRAEVFNVGSNAQHFTKRMIVEEIQKHVPAAQVEYRSGDTDPRNYRVSFGKIADRLGFECDHTVQRYLPALTAAVRSGVFPDAGANNRYGNFEVRHLA